MTTPEKKKLKILQFMASERWGGAEKVFVDLSNALACAHDVVVLLLRKTDYIDRFSDNVTVIELTSHPTRRNPFLLYELYRVLKKCRPDIIHTHAVKGAELIAKANRFLGYNHIATKHNARKGKIFEKLHWVTTISSQSFHSVSPRTGGEVVVINNGITPEDVHRGDKNDVFTLFAAGRLDSIKGFDILLDQAAQLTFPWKLNIAGEGKERLNLEHKMKQLGLMENVTLLGHSEGVAQHMADADLVVISSHSEGFPQVCLEAIFYGKVLISTPVGGVIEILPERFLTDHQGLAVKIEEVHDHYPSFAEDFERLRHTVSSSYLFENIVQQYVAQYRRIVSQSTTLPH